MELGCSNTYMIYISASQMWMPMSFLGILQKSIYFIQYIWYSAFLLFLEFFFFYWSIVALQCCVNFSVHFSRSVMSDSLQPHGLQDARLACLSPTPRAYSNSCPSTQWCHPTISSSVIPFSSCLQSFLASGSFPMSQFFTSGGQSIGAPALASVLPMNIQDWFPLGLTDLVSFQSKGLSRVISNTTVQKHHFFSAQLSLWSNSHS